MHYLKVQKLAEHLWRSVQAAREKSPLAARVRRIEIVEGRDSTDDPALDIWVLLANDVRSSDMTLKTIRPIEEAIWEEIRIHDEDRWPYIHFQRESEYDNMVRVRGSDR